MKVKICPKCEHRNSLNVFDCVECGETLSVKTIIEVDDAITNDGFDSQDTLSCPICGSHAQITDLFCTKCGTNIERAMENQKQAEDTNSTLSEPQVSRSTTNQVRLVTLSCPSCGGKLEIKSDINSFACGYCGSEHVVHREGGIVSLEAVGESLEGIEKATDRTALELALPRLEKELNQLKSTQQEALRKESRIENEISSASSFFSCWDIILLPLILGSGALVVQFRVAYYEGLIMRGLQDKIMWVFVFFMVFFSFLKYLEYTSRKPKVNKLKREKDAAHQKTLEAQSRVKEKETEIANIQAKLNKQKY